MLQVVYMLIGKILEEEVTPLPDALDTSARAIGLHWFFLVKPLPGVWIYLEVKSFVANQYLDGRFWFVVYMNLHVKSLAQESRREIVFAVEFSEVRTRCDSALVP